MPIQPKYTWRECSSKVELTVPLKGASPKIVDIILCSNHLKVSWPPYLLDLPLAENIDADSAESKALVKAGTLHITLVKLEEGKTWGNLLWEGTKEEINQRRMAAFAEREGRIQRQHEQAVSKRIENERMTLKMQMALEEDERQLIDDKKAAEKKAAEEALYKTLADLPAAGPAADNRTEQQLIPDDDDDDDDISVCNKSTTTTATSSTTSRPPPLPNRQVSSIPPPRATIRATFKHTPRPFQTPARESTVTTEREFLLKNKPSLLNGCGDTESSDVGDVDASWIAKKGEEFFAKGDYRSAVSAFSSSLKRDSTMVEAIAHRAASHLQLGDTEHCLTDLASAKSKTGMEALPGGVSDSSLRSKIEHMQAIAEAQQQKEKADELLRKNDLSGALLLYDKAIVMAPACIPALANRSACHLAMKNYEATASDCTSALDMLARSNLDEPSLEKPSSLQPRLALEVRKKLKDAVSRRRVLALEQLGQSDVSKGKADPEADASVEKAVAELDSVD